MSDDLSGDMLAPSWPNLVFLCVLLPIIEMKFMIIASEMEAIVCSDFVQVENGIGYNQ